MGMDEQFQAARQLHTAGKFAEAEAIYRAILKASPRHSDATHMLGVLAFQCGHLESAAQLIAQAIALHPWAAGYYNNLALVHNALGRTDLAVAAMRKSLALEPTAQGNNALGVTLWQAGRMYEAVDAFRSAIKLDATFGDPWTNLASVYEDQKKFDEAIEAARRGVQLNPASAHARSNLGRLFQLTGQINAAVAEFARASGFAPDEAGIGSNLLFAKLSQPEATEESILAAHRAWAIRFADPLTDAAPPHDIDLTTDRPIRVGYVSPDFGNHPVGRFILPALLGRDRARFHVTCYSDSELKDDTAAALKASADVWLETATLNDEQLATQIRADSIDILIDLTGHTARNRLLCFAREPAPIQATYLGYPATTGLKAIDFRLTDAIADPPSTSDANHTERLIRIEGCAWCFIPPANAPDIAERSAREEIHFGSFNNLSKLSPATLTMFAKVLNATTNSKLILKAVGMNSAAAQNRILSAFKAHEIDPSRVTFLAPTKSTEEHLASFAEVDIALDTFPYNGTTTTCESLWMGVPVITLAGNRHASRVGASLLTANGLPDFIADSPEAFVAIATRLAGDLDRRLHFRRTARETLLKSPPCDVPAFGARFARALDEMLKLARSESKQS